MHALILSGGQGTRLRPLTFYKPKTLLPIANIPFLGYLTASLRKHGVRKVTLCISDSARPYAGFVAAEKKLGTTITCSRELREMGTAGGVKNAQKFTDSSAFFVFNGDVFAEVDFTAMMRRHVRAKAYATVSLIGMEDPSPYGLVKMNSEGRINQFVEKPAGLKPDPGRTKYLINSGVYILDKKILDLIPRGKKYSFEKDLFPHCLRKNLPLFGFAAGRRAYWLDIGAPGRYLQANQDAINRRLPHSFPMPKRPVVGARSSIHPSARIDRDTVIGSHCRIGAGVFIKKCVIMDEVVIENDAVLENCIVGGHSRIGHNASATGSQLIGNHSIITPFSRI